MRRVLLVLALAWPEQALATVLVRFSLDDLVARAQRVVVGTVAGAKTVRAGRDLFTETTITVERTLLGPPASQLVLSQLGGRDGTRESGIVGDARFNPGERVLLVTYQHQDGRTYLVGMAQGVFRVHGERLAQDVDAALVNAQGGAVTDFVRARRVSDVEAAIQRRR